MVVLDLHMMWEGSPELGMHNTSNTHCTSQSTIKLKLFANFVNFIKTAKVCFTNSLVLVCHICCLIINLLQLHNHRYKMCQQKFTFLTFPFFTASMRPFCSLLGTVPASFSPLVELREGIKSCHVNKKDRGRNVCRVGGKEGGQGERKGRREKLTLILGPGDAEDWEMGWRPERRMVKHKANIPYCT